MVVTPGESYGYHVAAILWLAAHAPKLASIWFDTVCRLKPFMMKHIATWERSAELRELLGVSAEGFDGLKKAVYCTDEMHGSTHNGPCRDEFLGTMHPEIPSYRGGTWLGAQSNVPCFCRLPCRARGTGVQCEHLNAFIARVANTTKHESAVSRLETLYQFLGDRSLQQLDDLPRALARDADHVLLFACCCNTTGFTARRTQARIRIARFEKELLVLTRDVRFWASMDDVARSDIVAAFRRNVRRGHHKVREIAAVCRGM